MPAPYRLVFRREAVELLKRSGKSVPELARELGISPQSLRNWARQIDVCDPNAAHSPDGWRVAPRSRDNRVMSFLGAYLVAENSMGAPPVGVVRKDGNVWRILRFGIPADQQPSEAFTTRREAGARLMELASRA